MRKLLNGVSRRDVLNICRRFGVTSTILAASGLTGVLTAPRLAAAAKQTSAQRYSTQPKYQFRFGGSGYNADRLQYVRAGCLEFIQDLEERTNGAIRIEFVGENQICNELDCVKKAQQGVVDFFCSSTQNAAGAAPYYNVLDFAYMFPTRASFYHFLYHPKSNALFREPLHKLHRIQFLFSTFELRCLVMGSKFLNRPKVKTLEDLQGGKNRVTGSELSRIAMTLLGLNPVPLAWEETLDGLNQGLIDGAETWHSAMPAFNMGGTVSQVVNLNYMAGALQTAMSLDAFEKLDPEYQDAVMESAYVMQMRIQGAHEAGLYNLVGITDPPTPGSFCAQQGLRITELSPQEIEKAEIMAAPANNPAPWEAWRERLNKWSGGYDVYNEIHAIAREIPSDTMAQNVTGRRWWNS